MSSESSQINETNLENGHCGAKGLHEVYKALVGIRNSFRLVNILLSFVWDIKGTQGGHSEDYLFHSGKTRTVLMS
jgi:hypothetical protein